MKTIVSLVVAAACLLGSSVPAFAAENAAIPDEYKQKLMYLYKEKDPYYAMSISMVLPGFGNLYTRSGTDFIITWLFIGGGTALGMNTGILPTEENIRQAEYAIGAVAFGYIYGIVSSWFSAEKYNVSLRKSIRSGIQGELLLAGLNGNPGLSLQFSKKF